MRERVHLLGGRFSAGRAPEGGRRTVAELPPRAGRYGDQRPTAG
ncbi:hypothetical protein [Actinoplanes sp. NPDC051494]